MTTTVTVDELDIREILEKVEKHHEEVVITRDGEPVARISPVESLRGPMYGRIEFLGDIVEPLDEDWDANR